MSDIRGKILGGFFFIVLTMLVGRVLQIIASAVTTRILFPADFGIYAICLAVIGILQQASTFGLESALIQKAEISDEDLNVAWSYEFARNLLLFLVTFLFAAPLSILLNTPSAIPYIQVMSFSFILVAFRNIGVVKIKKRLEFGKQSILDLLPQVANIAATIALVIWLKDLWAIVFGSLFGYAVMAASSYLLEPFRPRFRFTWRVARPLFSFGVLLLCNTILTMLRDQGVVLIVKNRSTLDELGYYNRAMTFSYAIFLQVVNVFWRVAYPAFSSLQKDGTKLNLYWKKATLYSFFFVPILAVGAGILEPLVGNILSMKWIVIVPMMRIMFVQAGLMLLTMASEVYFQVIGKPQYGTQAILINTIFVIITLDHFLINYGILGAFYCQVIGCLLASLVIFGNYWRCRHTKMSGTRIILEKRNKL